MPFADFLTAADRDEVLLVVTRPRVILSGFVLDSTPRYSMSFSRLDGVGIPGGMYRRVVGVRENGTDLTLAASAAAVISTAMTWFWDEATETLYVHATAGGDPAAFTYQAIVEFYFATKPVVLNRTDGDPDTGIYYHPCVVSGLPQLTERDEEQLGGAKVTSGTRLGLVNGTGWWHEILAHDGIYRWKNARVEFLLGGSYNGGEEVLLRSEYTSITTMVVEDVTASEDLAELELGPLNARLSEQIPVTPYFPSTYPNLGDGVEGTKKWIGYGNAIMRPDLTDTAPGGGDIAIYTVADAAFQTLHAVNSVTAIRKSNGERDPTPLALTTDYTVNLTTCEITIVSGATAFSAEPFTSTDFDIEIDVNGKPGGADYLKTFGEIARDLLETFLGIRTTDIDTASFATADTDAPQPLSLWQKTDRSVAAILSTVQDGVPGLERSVQGLIHQTLDGKWTANIWSPTYVEDASLRQGQFAVFKPEANLEDVFSSVQVYYNRNLSTGSWSVEEATNEALQYQQDTMRKLRVYTYLTAPGDAVTLAQRLLVIFGGLSLEIEFEEVGVTLAANQVRDRVTVSYNPAPVSGGQIIDGRFEIVRLDRVLEPTLTIRGRLQNLRGVGDNVGQWKDPTAAAYVLGFSGASGFWLDTSGDPDSGNPGVDTDISVWW